MQKPTQWNVWYFALALLAILFIQDAWHSWRETEPLAYSEFMRLVDEGQIKEVVVFPDHVQGELTKPMADGRDKFVALRVDPAFAEALARRGVKVTGGAQN